MTQTKRDAIFYYLSGTGNSYRAACWMAEACGRSGVPARVSSIRHAEPDTRTAADGNSLIGLVTPTHGFTTPWLMLKFALRMPRRRGMPTLVVATRGGVKFGRLYLPGLEGTTAYLLALILALKGYSVRGVTGLDMPVNWTAVHPGFKESSARAIIARAKIRLDTFVKQIIDGGRYMTGLVPLTLGLLLLPVSLMYALIGRLWLGKLFFASHRCTGCGICAEGCPAQAIRMIGSRTRRPYWTFSCESCMRCMNACPERAIEASYSFAAVSYLITAVPVWLMVLNWAGRQWLPLEALNNVWIQAVLQYVYVLTSMALAYVIFHIMTRVPLLGRIFAVTTPTYYYRRYHEPDTRLNDIR